MFFVTLSLLGGAVGWIAVSDCGISWSYSLFCVLAGHILFGICSADRSTRDARTGPISSTFRRISCHLRWIYDVYDEIYV